VSQYFFLEKIAAVESSVKKRKKSGEWFIYPSGQYRVGSDEKRCSNIVLTMAILEVILKGARFKMVINIITKIVDCKPFHSSHSISSNNFFSQAKTPPWHIFLEDIYSFNALSKRVELHGIPVKGF
jgi:hypothetical protein